MPRKERDYKAERRNYDGKPEVMARNRERKRARYAMEKKYGKSALKGKDVDHKVPLTKGGSSSMSNLRIISQRANRSYDRNSDGSVKHNYKTKKK